jgi:hypothetical protein
LYAPQGATGRIANPDRYRELYLSSSAVGALSEAFGRFDIWSPGTFARRDLPYALATCDLPDGVGICDLDNAGRLLAYDLRPSDVVARECSITSLGGQDSPE